MGTNAAEEKVLFVLDSAFGGATNNRPAVVEVLLDGGERTLISDNVDGTGDGVNLMNPRDIVQVANGDLLVTDRDAGDGAVLRVELDGNRSFLRDSSDRLEVEDLDGTGDCGPAPDDLRWNVTKGKAQATVTVMVATATGSEAVANGACAGLDLGLDSPSVLGSFTLNDDGETDTLDGRFPVPLTYCGGKTLVINTSNCDLTVIKDIPAAP